MPLRRATVDRERAFACATTCFRTSIAERNQGPPGPGSWPAHHRRGRHDGCGSGEALLGADGGECENKKRKTMARKALEARQILNFQTLLPHTPSERFCPSTRPQLEKDCRDVETVRVGVQLESLEVQDLSGPPLFFTMKLAGAKII